MARSMAARARGSSTPASSNRIRPGCTTATHSSGLPLPEPMRVSAGFWVTGLSGKTRIQTLPPRFTCRVMAIRAASIWRAVSQPGSSAWIPKSPNVTEVPPLAAPVRRPRCVLRCLTFLGINMSVRVPPEMRRLMLLMAVLPLHLLVLGQLPLQVVGLGRRGEQVGHRSLRFLFAFFCAFRCRLRLHLGALDERGLDELILRGGLRRGSLLALALALDLDLGLELAVALTVDGREVLGAAAATPGRDQPARAALARRLADRHGGLAGDLVLDGDLVGVDVALVDPHLDADPARRGPGLAEAVVDVGPQGVQRHAALAVLLLAGHLRTAETARALHLDALRAGLLHGLDGTLHGAAEGDPPHELVT